MVESVLLLLSSLDRLAFASFGRMIGTFSTVDDAHNWGNQPAIQSQDHWPSWNPNLVFAKTLSLAVFVQSFQWQNFEFGTVGDYVDSNSNPFLSQIPLDIRWIDTFLQFNGRWSCSGIGPWSDREGLFHRDSWFIDALRPSPNAGQLTMLV